MQEHSNKRTVVFAVAILLLVLVIIYSAIRIMDTVEPAESDVAATKTIERNGKKYFPRQDITVFLIMGIDIEGKVQASGSYNNDGAADVVALAVFDESNETYSVLCLNRDTMLEIPVLGIGGKRAGTTVAQLALSHTYGSGLEDSCVNTKTAVSDFLYGLDIDYYVSFNMEAIGILNDAVGGVTVNVTDDFTEIDPSIKKGTVTLNASQALNYVRTRKGLGDQTNLSRMERHKEYLNGFFAALGKKIDQSASFMMQTYSDVSDYMVSDCSLDVLTALTTRYSDYTLKEIISPEGENRTDKEYIEFYVDEEKLDQIILGLFYAEKK